MARVEVVCFDLDRTLLDVGANRDALRRTCEVVADAMPGLDAGELLAADTMVWQAYFPEVEELWATGRLETAALGREAWRRALAACGCDDEQLVKLAQDTLHRHTSAGYCLFDDVLGCLESLRPGLRMALVTNGASDLQREKLRLLGIEGRFDLIVVSGEHGVAKPDPRVFEVVVDAFGVTPASVWHVGDNLEADVGGAKAAGLTAVWLNRNASARRDGEPEPDYEIASLAELGSLISQAA